MSIKSSTNQLYVRILIFLPSKKNELQSLSLYIQKYHKSFLRKVSVIFEISSPFLLSLSNIETGKKEMRQWEKFSVLEQEKRKWTAGTE